MPNEIINATIQLDKLVICCVSSIDDNFNDAIKYYPDEAFKTSHSFGKTKLTQTIDRSRRYKHSYHVHYAGTLMGRIDFCLFGQPHKDDEIWFSISNKVFYNNTLQFLPMVFSNLNMKLHNITRLEIALDSYHFNHEKVLRQNIRNRENTLKIMGKIIDRKARISKAKYWNYGSPDNPFQVRTTYIQNKRLIHYPPKKRTDEEDTETQHTANQSEHPKTTIELITYNKSEEIQDFSPHKTYIFDYHKAHNPKYKNIYRMEIRLASEELSRFVKKHKKPIELTDLLDKQFLYDVFREYVDRIIVIRDNKKQKIELYPMPFLGTCEGKLPLPLPEVKKEPQPIVKKEIIINKNENKDIIKKEDLKKDIYKRPLIITINTLHHEKESKTIGSNQAENQQCFKGQQQPQLWQTTFANP